MEKPRLIVALTSAIAGPLTAELVGARAQRLVMPASLQDSLYALKKADALLVNLGSLCEERAMIMKETVLQANKLGKPWILDPVGAGGSQWRTHWAEAFMRLGPALIKGNSAEIIALSGGQAKLQGIDSLNDSQEAEQAASQLSQDLQSTIWVTGRLDIITSANRAETSLVRIKGGDQKMTRLVSLGCAIGALGAVAICDDLSKDEQQGSALVQLAQDIKNAGQSAAKQSFGLASFRSSLIDALSL